MNDVMTPVCEMLGVNLPAVRRDRALARTWLETRLQPVART